MHGLFRWSSKWWPGVIPLVVFWAIAAWTTTPPLESDLAARSAAALKDSLLDKTRITVAGRDVTFAADAFSEDGRRGAVASVAAVPGVRLVNDETQLVPEAKPFDTIILAAASAHVPQALLDQLAPEGRLVMPLGRSGHRDQVLLMVENSKQGFVETHFDAVRFVPLLPGVE